MPSASHQPFSLVVAYGGKQWPVRGNAAVLVALALINQQAINLMAAGGVVFNWPANGRMHVEFKSVGKPMDGDAATAELAEMARGK